MYPQRTRARARSRRRRRRWPLFLLVFAIALCALGASQLGFGQMHRLKTADLPDWVDKQIISINGTGRRGEKLDGVTDIAIHYTGNPGTTAQQNHDFYDQPETQVSSHFLVGLEGEVIQCVPMDEKSSATNERNNDTLSIEVCHPDATGQFTQASYDCPGAASPPGCATTAGIGRDRVIRHYDVTEQALPPVLRGAPRRRGTQFLGGCGGLLRPGPRPALPGGPPLPKSAGGPVGTGAG